MPPINSRIVRKSFKIYENSANIVRTIRLFRSDLKATLRRIVSRRTLYNMSSESIKNLLLTIYTACIYT